MNRKDLEQLEDDWAALKLILRTVKNQNPNLEKMLNHLHLVMATSLSHEKMMCLMRENEPIEEVHTDE